jgi:hypothetical protein
VNDKATVNRGERSLQPAPQFWLLGGIARENNDLCAEGANPENSLPGSLK